MPSRIQPFPARLLTLEERTVLGKLTTPAKIQDFLDVLPFNHERGGTSNRSPRGVLRAGRAHCMEGAMLAALALWLRGEEPLLMDLQSTKHDDDHVVALYRTNGLWGAISKTNHAVLRFRDPVYRTPRELALSYFHEYFLNDGTKTLRTFSVPFDMRRLGFGWATAEGDLWKAAEALNDSRHLLLFPKRQARLLRKAARIERDAGKLVEWRKSDSRT